MNRFLAIFAIIALFGLASGGLICQQQVYRWYNDVYYDHFLTLNSTGELAPSLGYSDEGPKFITLKAKVSSQDLELFRLFKGHQHFYTTSPKEKAQLVAKGYTLEGNIGYCYSTKKPGTVPLLRYFTSDPVNQYLWTSNPKAGNLDGWVFQRRECYVYPEL